MIYCVLQGSTNRSPERVEDPGVRRAGGRQLRAGGGGYTGGRGQGERTHRRPRLGRDT